jgi:hypothetical protein
MSCSVHQHHHYYRSSITYYYGYSCIYLLLPPPPAVVTVAGRSPLHLHRQLSWTVSVDLLLFNSLCVFVCAAVYHRILLCNNRCPLRKVFRVVNFGLTFFCEHCENTFKNSCVNSLCYGTVNQQRLR